MKMKIIYNWGSPCNNRLGARDIFRFSFREAKCRKSIVPEKISENEGKKTWAYRISKKAQIMFKKFSDLTCHLRNKKSARFAGTFSSRASRAARKFERA